MTPHPPYRPLATQRRLFGNTALLTGGQVVVQLLNFGIVVGLARVYGRDLLGVYSFSMAVGAVLCTFVSLGTHGLLLQRIAREPEQTASYTGALFGFQLSVAVAIVLAAHVAARWLSSSATMIWVLTAIVAFHVLTRVNSLFVLGFTARQQAGAATIVPIAKLGFALLLAAAAVAAGASAPVALAAMPIAAALVLTVTAACAVRRFGPLRIRFRRAEIITYLREGMPFFYVVALTASYSRLGVILLTTIGGEAATGAYAAAERLVSAVATVYAMLSMALLPVVTQLWKTDRGRFAELTQRATRLTLLITLPATTMLVMFANDIVHVLYGGGIPEAATVLAVIAWILLARGFVQLVVTAATATEHQAILIRGRVFGIAVLTVAGLALIPTYGAVGLAGATLVGESAAVALTYARLRRAGVPLAIPPGTLRAALACLLTAGCVWLAHELALPWRLFVAAFAMSAALWLFGAVRSHDLAYLRAVLRARDARTQAEPDA
jgi:O-antigen/teichoic acid export membrane protein